MSSCTYFFGNEGTSFELRTVRISGFEDNRFTGLVDLPVLRLQNRIRLKNVGFNLSTC